MDYSRFFFCHLYRLAGLYVNEKIKKEGPAIPVKAGMAGTRIAYSFILYCPLRAYT